MTGRVLVTGASGFVGRPLVRALADAGVPVRATSRDPRAAGLPATVETVATPDYRSAVDWTPLLAGVDRVVHLAGIAHTGVAASTAAYEQVVHRATAELAAACARAGVPRLVFMSSVRAQTGPAADTVLTEDDAAQPSDDYGRAKLAAEDAVRVAAVDWTILRPVLVYGPGVKGNLAGLLRLADTPWPLPVKGFGGRRSLLSLDNLIAAVRHVLQVPAAARQTYLVADPAPVTLPQILVALRRGLGRPPRMFALPGWLFETGLRGLGKEEVWQRLNGSLVADPGKLMRAGWRPQGNTMDGLASMAAAQREKGLSA